MERKYMKRIAGVSVVTLALTMVISVLVHAALSINGAGATFPYPVYSKWFDEYQKKNSQVQINYQSIGSGGGIRQITEGTVDFGASDGPMNDEQLKAFQDKHGFGILHFPTVLGADVPTYNIPGVTSALNFTPEALAGIFLGKITKWNDPAIVATNKGVRLPANDIVVVHRSDGSGTTYIWTDYLSKVSDEWKNKVGKGASVNWPVGLGGKGNEGVTGQIKNAPSSIGYVELIYAVSNNIPYGSVKNSSGNFVKADLASVSRCCGRGKDDAGRFPGLDYRSAWQNGLSDREFYVAADSGEVFERGEAGCDQGLFDVDDGGRAELCGATVLREAAERSNRQRKEGAEQHPVSGAVPRVQGNNGCNCDRSERKPRFGLAVVSEPAARGRRNRAADYVFVCGVGSCGHAAADLRAMAGLRFGAAQVRVAFFCDARLGSGLRAVRGASVHLRHLGDGNGGAGNCGAAGNRSGHFPGGTGAGESVGHAGIFHRPAGVGAERDLRLAGSVYRGAADAGLRATGAEEDAGIFAVVFWARIRGGLFDSRCRAGDHDHSLHYFGVARGADVRAAGPTRGGAGAGLDALGVNVEGGSTLCAQRHHGLDILGVGAGA